MAGRGGGGAAERPTAPAPGRKAVFLRLLPAPNKFIHRTKVPQTVSTHAFWSFRIARVKLLQEKGKYGA